MPTFIHDDGPLGSIETQALCINWGVRRCNVSACTAKPNAIISGIPNPEEVEELVTIGLCEDHYQQGQRDGRLAGTFDFDDFDAFKRGGVE